MSHREIRPIDRASDAEIRLVAQRMRQTLEEVLGEERGRALYDMQWLEDRVRWHLDDRGRRAEILLAVDSLNRVFGHTIVRVEPDDGADAFGLFSTIFVEPRSRNGAVATELVTAGEAWMRSEGMQSAKTYTDSANAKLINLFTKLGYELRPGESEMVILTKTLPGA